MRVRESGMPDESQWEGCFDVDLILDRMGIDDSLANVAELGCGYGTFTIPVAERVSGRVITFDVDPAMLERTRVRAVEAGLRTIACVRRDVVARGGGIGDGVMDAVLLFNILHGEDPVELLRSAARITTVGGWVLAIHWRCDVETPRGPSAGIRPSAEAIAEWGQETGLLEVVEGGVDLAPWHRGVRMRRVG